MTIRPNAHRNADVTWNEPSVDGSPRGVGEGIDPTIVDADADSEEEENAGIDGEASSPRAVVLLVTLVCITIAIPLIIAAALPQMPDWLDLIMSNFPELALAVCGVLIIVHRLVQACRGKAITFEEQFCFFWPCSVTAALFLPMLAYCVFLDASNKGKMGRFAFCVAVTLAVCSAFGLHTIIFQMHTERLGWPIPVLSAKMHAGGWIIFGIYSLFKIIDSQHPFGGEIFVGVFYSFGVFSACKYAQCLVRLRQMSSATHNKEGDDEASSLLYFSSPSMNGTRGEVIKAYLDEMLHFIPGSRSELNYQRGRMVLTSKRLIFLSTGLQTHTYPPTHCLGLSSLSKSGSETWDLEDIDWFERGRTKYFGTDVLQLHLLRRGMVAIFLAKKNAPTDIGITREHEVFANRTMDAVTRVQCSEGAV